MDEGWMGKGWMNEGWMNGWLDKYLIGQMNVIWVCWL